MSRDYMIEFRKKHGIDRLTMAKKCKVSRTLLGMLESSDQEVTHPNIAKRIAKAYKLTNKQAEGLIPEHYRKSSPHYDPDKFRRQDYEYADFAVTTRWRNTGFM